jgi:hypothetical protein
MKLGRNLRKVILHGAPAGIYWLLKAIHSSIHWVEINSDQIRPFVDRREPVILAFWHGRMLMAPFFYRGRGLRILISRHSDGELIHRVMTRFGFKSVRGSSRRAGKEAFRELIRWCRDGWDIAITPDGPRGPRYVVQKGVIELARKTSLPILPVTYSTQRRIRCPSWDEMLIPWPFTKGVFIWGRPLWIEPQCNAAVRENHRKSLESLLRRMTKEADDFFCHPPAPDAL